MPGVDRFLINTRLIEHSILTAKTKSNGLICTILSKGLYLLELSWSTDKRATMVAKYFCFGLL